MFVINTFRPQCETLGPTMNDFYSHLNKCAQCRNHPFELCEDGAELLKESAQEVIKPFDTRAAHLKWYHELCKELGVEPLI